MKLVLCFVHPSRPAKTVGPFNTLRLDGESVRDPEKRALIARHREHQWEVGGERYSRLDATVPVRIHFERPPEGTASRVFGPYRRFSAIDGIAYTDDRVFAFVDPKVGDWFCYNDGQHWPVMVLSDAAEDRGRGRLVSLAALAPLVGGVIGLWKRGRLFYVDPDAVGWETHPDPARREAELLAGLGARYTSLCSSA